MIRLAEQSDIPGILAIYNHAVLHDTATADVEPQSLQAREEWLVERQNQGLPVLVAAAEPTDEFAGPEEIVGWASLNPYHTKPGYRFTVENSVYVAERARGRGVGRMLLAELLQRAEELPVHAVIASIDSSNAVSIYLHASFGFQECGRLPQLYTKFGRWLDVTYMVRLFPFAP